jgi:hypothetical protein
MNKEWWERNLLLRNNVKESENDKRIQLIYLLEYNDSGEQPMMNFGSSGVETSGSFMIVWDNFL